jgi:hypothetical protein
MSKWIDALDKLKEKGVYTDEQYKKEIMSHADEFGFMIGDSKGKTENKKEKFRIKPNTLAKTETVRLVPDNPIKIEKERLIPDNPIKIEKERLVPNELKEDTENE